MSHQNENIKQVVVILSGGAGRRMGGVDKGEVMLGGRRLIDHMIDRLAPQADRLLISGVKDYGAGLTAIADRDDGPRGPAAGLWAAAHWMGQHLPAVKFFVTAPADGPFVPPDLVAQLTAPGACAFASDENGDHPTFACWEIQLLLETLRKYKGKGVALRDIASLRHATRVVFSRASQLMNINTSEDLARAETLMQGAS
jgi:molybdenum cofactor guanylyltransferase